MELQNYITKDSKLFQSQVRYIWTLDILTQDIVVQGIC